MVQPLLDIQQGYWGVAVEGVSLAFLNGSSLGVRGACSGFVGVAASAGSGAASPPCIGILDSGTSQIIGSIDQVCVVVGLAGPKQVTRPPSEDTHKGVEDCLMSAVAAAGCCLERSPGRHAKRAGPAV